MINKHPGDDEIQQYVLQKKESDMATHIKNCSTCRIRVKQYHLLSNEIQQLEKPAFDFDVAELVMQQLSPSQCKGSEDKWFYYSMILIPVFLLSTVLYFFKDGLLDLFKGITLILSATIITTFTCLFVFLCMDMYRKYRRQMKILDFN